MTPSAQENRKIRQWSARRNRVLLRSIVRETRFATEFLRCQTMHKHWIMIVILLFRCAIFSRSVSKVLLWNMLNSERERRFARMRKYKFRYDRFSESSYNDYMILSINDGCAEQLFHNYSFFQVASSLIEMSDPLMLIDGRFFIDSIHSYHLKR